jgi:hypothetical protein
MFSASLPPGGQPASDGALAEPLFEQAARKEVEVEW